MTSFKEYLHGKTKAFVDASSLVDKEKSWTIKWLFDSKNSDATLAQPTYHDCRLPPEHGWRQTRRLPSVVNICWCLGASGLMTHRQSNGYCPSTGIICGDQSSPMFFSPQVLYNVFIRSIHFSMSAVNYQACVSCVVSCVVSARVCAWLREESHQLHVAKHLLCFPFWGADSSCSPVW